MASPRKVLLVGWDAADWKIIQPLLDAGELPVLESIVNGGVMGNLASIQPMLSPMLWTSIATGKRPFKHGVHGFTEPAYDLCRVVPVSSSTRQCAALWNILNRAGLKTNVAGWFATHPAEQLDGACVSDQFASPAPLKPDAPWPLGPGTIWPRDIAETLGALRVRPADIDGSVLAPFIPQLARIDQRHDKRPLQLAVRLAECFSIHAAATWLLENRPWDFAAVYYRTIDWICHDFIAFHPPRMNFVYDAEFDLYHNVVSSAYRLHDMLLGRLLQLAGPDTSILLVSDHGFQTGRLRPTVTPKVPAGIAAWHRPTGVLAMRGTGLRKDELIHGASLLDIAPTILALYGLEIGRDMDGRVLVEAFEEPPQIRMRNTWDEPPVSNPREPETRGSAGGNRELLRQFADLGYIDDPADDPDEALRGTARENNWNLARSFLDAGRFAAALPLLEDVHAEWPEREDYGFELALCQLNLSLDDEALETARDLIESPGQFQYRLLLANIEFRRGQYQAALDHLAAIEAADAKCAFFQNQLGLIYVRMRRWEEAGTAYNRSLEIDPDDPHAHLGLAHCQLHARQYHAAADEALNTLGLKFDLPLAHYDLGIALAHLGDEERAIQAFELAMRYRPNWPQPVRYLAVLRAHQPGAQDRVREHREQVNLRTRLREEAAGKLAALRRGIAERELARDEKRSRRRAASHPAGLLVSPREPLPSAPLEFLIVSGLPRSGTSLMMQMIEAGGAEIMRDNLRPADENNPRGYFEWQEIKKLPKNPRLIEQAHGKAVKVISMLLPFLPKAHRYKVIFMTRPLDEVAASQEAMLGRSGPASGQNHIIDNLRSHREKILDLLMSAPQIELLEIDYPALLADPIKWSERIGHFANFEKTAPTSMAAVIDPALRHHR